MLTKPSGIRDGPMLALDEPAGRVLEHLGSHLLVLGGPGTGKTTLLEARYLHLVREAGLLPHRILFLCNNRSYSNEARDRLFWQLPQEASIEVPIFTWHALAYHLVARYYARLGYRQPPVLLPAAEQWGAVKELLGGEKLTAWGPWAERISDDAFVDEVANFCLRVQQRMMTPEDLDALAGARPDWKPVVDFAARYRACLLGDGRLDYAGLISEAVRLLGQEPEVRSALLQRFSHVLVDDAQEMSQAHVKLLEAFDEAEICAAADPDSGIEKFRGAEPDWVYGFGARFPGTKQIVLERSYRIGAPLGPALGGLMAQNEPDDGRRPSGWSLQPTDFECRIYRSVWEEVDAVAREFRRLHILEGVSFDRMAVLLSQPGRLLTATERALAASEVPARTVFGDRALGMTPEVRAFLDLARVATKAPDWHERLPELLTSPLIGLELTSRRRLQRQAWRRGQTLAEVVEEAPECAEFRRLRDIVAENAHLADECFWAVWTSASFYRDLAMAAKSASRSESTGERSVVVSQAKLAASLAALAALGHSLGRFVERRRGTGSIGDYLSEAARADFGSDPWVSSSAPGEPAVTISSFQSAKGKQWDYVAVVGCLDSWIPKGSRAQGLFDPFALETPDIADRRIESLADDRRTFYVAASRARQKVVFSASASAGGRGRPSRFLTELGAEMSEPVDVYGLSPLSLSELAAGLRRTLASPGSSPAERVAAVAALAEIPGVDPSRWYGVREWTPGSVPVASGKLRTSYSRLSPFENCGLQYVLQSVLGLDHESTHSMKFGTWMHALFEAVHKGEIRDVPSLKSEYAALFDDKIFPNAAIARQFRKDGEKMLQVFWENEVDRHTVSSEHFFEDVEVGGASIRGRIDRVDLHGKVLKLTDYKTARWAPSFRHAERSLQLALYHLAARNDPELSKMGYPQIARLVYPGALSRRGEYQVLNQTAEQADRVLEELPDMIRRVLEEDFRPNPEADCYFCKMKMLCPLWPAGREVPG